MEQYQLYAALAVLLFAAGFYALLTNPHLLRKILALNVMSSGVFPDPVPQAMVLTGIVVAVSVSARAMVLARRIYQETGNSTFYSAADEPQDEESRE